MAHHFLKIHFPSEGRHAAPKQAQTQTGPPPSKSEEQHERRGVGSGPPVHAADTGTLRLPTRGEQEDSESVTHGHVCLNAFPGGILPDSGAWLLKFCVPRNC